MKKSQKLISITLILLAIVFISYKLLNPVTERKNDTIDLSGEWGFRIDSLDQGIKEKWFTHDFSNSISLPGSMAENNLGNKIDISTKWTGNIWNDSIWYKDPKYKEYRKPNNLKFSFWLEPNKKYHGAAWYQKKITIPKHWEKQPIVFSIERAHWESTLWIDGKRVGSENTLGTSHEYNVGKFLTPGQHTIIVLMDNRVKEINVGLDAHSISDNTQTNWNGLVGEIKLTTYPKVYIEHAFIRSSISEKKIMIKLETINNSAISQNASIKLSAKSLSNYKYEIPSKITNLQLKKGKSTVTIDFPLGDNPLLWDEFEPNLYELILNIKSETGDHTKRLKFGMREFKKNKTTFEVNGKPVFLRGTLECAIFPLTGYPSTDIERWKKIFTTIKKHGLNHMRFHSWCPPEAAFQAADELGVYLQIEASAWATIGDGKPIDKWLYKEGKKILQNYGNHPSFVMMAYGNEPHGKNHKAYLVDYINYLRSIDSTKLYTSAAGWPKIKNADYFNTPQPRIQHWNQNLKSIINSKPPQTTFDYQQIIDNAGMPIVSHEIGQWCVYPNFKEMDKYTGVLKPKNFEIFQETLIKNHMGQLADSFLLASGKLQTLCYKADIEASLRTKGQAGFQLLDLHDFPGQGTALVGVLDAFWDQKGYVSPEKFNSFSGQTVPLARFEKRIFLNTDTLMVNTEIAHYGPKPLDNAQPKWQIESINGEIFAQGSFNKQNISIGNGIHLGTIDLPLINCKKAKKLKLKLTVDRFTNEWDFWVYPANQKIQNDQIKIVKTLNKTTIEQLQKGGNVLLSLVKGSLKPEMGGDIGVGFSSIFWNTSWTKGQKPHTLGILCNPKHPALANFPTEYHSNWQWWDAMTYSNAIILDHYNPKLNPIVRVIDDWFSNKRLALLFEVKIGKGKLLISGIDFHTDIEKRIEAKQLLKSLTAYMNTSKFNPQHTLSIAAIEQLYKM